MANYQGFTDIEKLADAYGYDMMLYGKSLYWSSPRKCEDTTNDLQACDLYKKLTDDQKETLLEYGAEMKRFGMGCYQERGYCAELYEKYAFKGGVPNPFAGGKGSQPNQPGM